MGASPVSIKNRLDRCCYCCVDGGAPALDGESLSSLWGCCLSRAALTRSHSCQVVRRPDPRCITAATQGVLGLLFFMDTPWLAKTCIPKCFCSLCTALRSVALRQLSALGSKQVEKVAKDHLTHHTCPAMASQVLRVSRCSHPLRSPGTGCDTIQWWHLLMAWEFIEVRWY